MFGFLRTKRVLSVSPPLNARRIEAYVKAYYWVKPARRLPAPPRAYRGGDKVAFAKICLCKFAGAWIPSESALASQEEHPCHVPEGIAFCYELALGTGYAPGQDPRLL